MDGSGKGIYLPGVSIYLTGDWDRIAVAVSSDVLVEQSHETTICEFLEAAEQSET